MIYGALYLWFILTLASFLFVLYDQLTNTPSMRIMTLAWLFVILYTGPIGLFFYFLSCRQPLKDTHEEYIKDHWKQALGSEIHCVAGDATAIICTAAFLFYYNLPNGLEAVIEYVIAYLFGLLIFQALFMRSMYSSYLEAVTNSIFAETVSMNYVMAGMLPTIILFKYHYPTTSDPTSILFWGLMSLATLIGFIFAYPVNSWMVKNKIKHGMMSKDMKMEHHDHHMEISTKTKTIHVVGSFAFLFLVAYVVSFFAPISF